MRNSRIKYIIWACVGILVMLTITTAAIIMKQRRIAILMLILSTLYIISLVVVYVKIIR